MKTLNGRIKFLYEFIKNPKEVSSITQSSKFLIQELVNPIDFYKAQYIIEFGAGDGCVTKEILKRIKNNCKVLSFEIKKEFLKELRKIRDKRLKIVEDRAENLFKYINSRKVDYIVSSLPLAASKNLEYKIIKIAYKSLKENGKYIQYQYAHNTLKSFYKLKKKFRDLKVKFIPLNMPPAFVYICKK